MQAAAMERSVDVGTPESVAFSYELAGLGSRFIAVAIDIAVQIAVVVVLAIVAILIAAGAPRSAAALGAPDKVAYAILLGLLIFGAFLLFDGYFILFEWLWNGRTPGKRLIGIRVVRDGGFPLDFVSSVIRNAIRILEFGLGFYAISAIATLLSPRNRRLGDMAAGTLVVRDAPLTRAPLAPHREDELALGDLLISLSDNERDLIRRYAVRRKTLARHARHTIAAQIAGLIRPHLPPKYNYFDDDDLVDYLASTSLSTAANEKRSEDATSRPGTS